MMPLFMCIVPAGRASLIMSDSVDSPHFVPNIITYICGYSLSLYTIGQKKKKIEILLFPSFEFLRKVKNKKLFLEDVFTITN